MAISYNANIGDSSVTASGNMAAVTGASKLGTLSDGTLRFIPTLWSSKINKRFYATTVFGEISNNDYSGEISGLGDKVIIMNSPTVTISDYTIGSTLTYERPPMEKVEMVIDKAKSFAYKVNDVEKFQTKADYMAEFADAAAQQLKVAIDASVLQNSNFYAAPLAANKGNAAGAKSGQIKLGALASTTTAGDNALKLVSGTASTGECNVFDLITRLSAVLDEQNVPENDRWLLVPPLFRTRLAQTTQATALIQGSETSMYRNGKIGMVDRWTLYVTNQLYTAAATGGTGAAPTCTYIMAGHKSALCFASQISTVESMKDPTDFGMLIRGLNVYGYKVVKPESLASAVVYF